MKAFIPTFTLAAIALTVGANSLPAAAENLEHTQRLVSSRTCEQCDLTRAGLVFANLQNANLRASDLSLANLNRANLSNANLQGATLMGTVLSNTNLMGADLRGADLRGADLREAYLTGARLEGANLEGANLQGAVGIPNGAVNADQLYVWGLTETQRGNYQGAITYLNQALDLQPDFAHAYLARGIVRFRMRNIPSAQADTEQAEQLYMAQANASGYQAATQFRQGISEFQANETAVEERERRSARNNNFMNFVGGLLGLMLRFVL